MSTAYRNLFGPNFPLAEVDRTCRALGIRKGDRVLEVGGAGNPFPRADVVCDLTFGSCAQRNGAPGVFRSDVAYVEAPAEELPFEDGTFDFVYCTQVLEHVRDPAAACRELARVAARGFVEVPSRMGEMVCGNPTHRWIVDRQGRTLIFTPRPFVEHPLRNFFYGLLLRDAGMRRLVEHDLRNIFNHQVRFRGRFPCRVLDPPGPRFDYDDPVQAGRAHYSFARNTLAAGAEPSYAYPDALEAAHLLPTWPPARLLLANFQARLLQFQDALLTLEGLPGAPAETLRHLVTRLQTGALLQVDALPLPAEEGPSGTAVAAEVRPLVTVVVAGRAGEALREAAESALTQDYPAVEVVVSSIGPLDDGWRRLQMGDRLRLEALPPETSLGAALNRGAIAGRGCLLAFLLEGDTFSAHHLERLAGHLVVTGAAAVHGDRLLLTGQGVAGPDIVAGNPASAAASLSTLVARRDFLVEMGGLSEDEGEAALLHYLLRLASTGRLVHVPEATVHSRRPLPAGVEVLEPVRAAARLRPLELLRDLLAAHVREEGLRARLQELEKRISLLPPQEAPS